MDKDLEYGQNDFNLPHDVVNLPSNGKFYKTKKKSLKVGFLTASDENILFGTRSEDLISTLLRSKIFEADINPNDLIWGDIEAVLIFLRNSSFGSEYTVRVKDPETDKEFTYTILLDNLKKLDVEVEPDENGLFTITLPKTKNRLKIKPLTYGERREIEEKTSTYPQGMIAPVVTWRLEKQIVELNGKTDKGEIVQMIEKLPIMDSKFIRNFLRKNEPKIDLNFIIKTPSGKNMNVLVDFGPEFFRPFF